MSKLSEELTAIQTNNRRAVPMKYVYARDHFRETTAINFESVIEYNIECTFKFKGVARDPESLSRLCINAKRAVVEAVFGEFRSTIMDINSALYDADIEAAKAHLMKLEADMFTV